MGEAEVDLSQLPLEQLNAMREQTDTEIQRLASNLQKLQVRFAPLSPALFSEFRRFLLSQLVA